jgi:hypothetical protein
MKTLEIHEVGANSFEKLNGRDSSAILISTYDVMNYRSYEQIIRRKHPNTSAHLCVSMRASSRGS